MRSILDSVHVDSSSLGPHYTEILRLTLTTLWRRKLLVVTVTAAAILLGAVAALVMPKQYTVDALIHGGFTAPDLASDVSGHSGTSFDASQLVETQSRLLQSHQLALIVVERLGLERLHTVFGASPVSTWLRAKFYGDVSEKDKAAALLLRGLSVNTEPRVYLIRVSYTAGDPTFAALVVNTFVAEFLRGVELQKLSEQQAFAKATLSEKLATFGEKYPQVSETRLRLAAAGYRIQAESSKTPEQILRDAGEKITLAQANTVPAGPNPPFIICISLLAGLVAGVGFAIYLPAGRGAHRLAEGRHRSADTVSSKVNPLYLLVRRSLRAAIKNKTGYPSPG